MIQRRTQRGGCHPAPGTRRAFTLVVLLVVMMVISILASFVLFAVQSAQESAKQARTKALIAKIDAIVMQRYESYRTRRVPLDISKIDTNVNDNNEPEPMELAFARLQALRELMKIELPDRWKDVTGSFSTGNRTEPFLVDRTALSHGYQAAIAGSTGHRNFNRYQAAECLYLIVMSTPGASEQFSESDRGDKDGDELYEFHDAWGNPISFIRWPAGFRSPRQPYHRNFRNLRDEDPWPLNGDRPQIRHDPQENHDPLDTRRFEEQAYALYPLIYSAGPDGEYDIIVKTVKEGENEADDNTYYPMERVSSTPRRYAIDPYRPVQSSGGLTGSDGPYGFVGTPKDANDNDEDEWHDNIHNHALGTGVR